VIHSDSLVSPEATVDAGPTVGHGPVLVASERAVANDDTHERGEPRIIALVGTADHSL